MAAPRFTDCPTLPVNGGTSVILRGVADSCAGLTCTTTAGSATLHCDSGVWKIELQVPPCAPAQGDYLITVTVSQAGSSDYCYVTVNCP